MNKPSRDPISHEPRPISLTDYLRYQTRDLTSWLGKRGVQYHISPDAITILGLIMVMLAALIVAQGQFLAAGIVLIIGMPLDALDGAIARAMNRKNRFGALLDATLDRYADGFIYCGIAYYFAAHAQINEMALTLFALIGAYAVSYVRARAEGLNIASIRDGLFDRLVRTLVLIGTLLTGWLVPGLIILALGSHLTALQRIAIVYRLTRTDDPN